MTDKEVIKKWKTIYVRFRHLYKVISSWMMILNLGPMHHVNLGNVADVLGVVGIATGYELDDQVVGV
jgi:hypothetical protein